jgi:hypothetical protein
LQNLISLLLVYSPISLQARVDDDYAYLLRRQRALELHGARHLSPRATAGDRHPKVARQPAGFDYLVTDLCLAKCERHSSLAH